MVCWSLSWLYSILASVFSLILHGQWISTHSGVVPLTGTNPTAKTESRASVANQNSTLRHMTTNNNQHVHVVSNGVSLTGAPSSLSHRVISRNPNWNLQRSIYVNALPGSRQHHHLHRRLHTVSRMPFVVRVGSQYVPTLDGTAAAQVYCCSAHIGVPSHFFSSPP